MAVQLQVFFILLAGVSTVLTQKVVNHGSPASFVGNMELHPSYRLASTSLNVTSLVDSAEDCAFLCVRLSWCVSYNFGKTADENNKHLCEALSVDRYNNSNSFQPNSDFEHFSVASPCSKNPCQNGGTCTPVYETNDVHCTCSNPRKYQGKYCQDEIFPTTCKEAIEINSLTEDKAYPLLIDHEQVQVYCAVNELSGCTGGGWTLAMKINGSKQTFTYESTYWSNKNAYNLAGGATGLDGEETKMPTYWNTPVTKLCVGMKVDSDTHFIEMSKQADSLYALVADGVHRSASLSRDTWKSLISGSSLQSYCNREGFNFNPHGSYLARARFGSLETMRMIALFRTPSLGLALASLGISKRRVGTQPILTQTTGIGIQRPCATYSCSERQH